VFIEILYKNLIILILCEEKNDVHHQFERIFFNDPTTTRSPYYPSGSCASNPCEHGGKCLNVQDDYRCECTNDYDGKEEIYIRIFLYLILIGF
jgi:hypothetical protein